MKKICFVTASDVTIKAFMINHLIELSKVYEITIITNTDNKFFLEPYNLKNINLIKVDISRKISLKKDINSLIQLIKIFKRENYNTIHSITPKAGLITSIAGKITNIENRVHIFTGQVWKNYSGVKRELFKLIDKLISNLNTEILIDSHSQKEFLIKEKVLKKNQGIVLGSGSISGVDMNRFKLDKLKRQNLRKELNIKEDEVLFGFLGRLTNDKGIKELLEAFNCKELRENKLLIVGPDEEGLTELLKKENIIYLGHQSIPEDYLNIMDIFCLPSHREGFGSVLIEAGAMGLPCIASNIYGIQDAIKDKKTGLLHEVKDIEDLRSKLIKLNNDAELRGNLGKEAKKRVLKEFSSEKVTEEWVKFYTNMIKK